MLLVTMPFFVSLSMMFGPWEMFWFGIFGVFIAANLSEGDTIKGLIAATVGLILGCVGLDPIDGSPRFAFGSTYLIGGIPLIPAMIGLYGFTEVFTGLTDISVKSFPLKKTSLIGAAKLWWKYRWLSVRTSILGYIIGVAPGIGANVSCWVGYDHARSSSKEPEKFGKGSVEGLIGSETCNMANVPGAYAPVLSLAIPGDAPTAIMLGILMIHGVRPGPTFLLTNAHWLYDICAALFIGGIFFVIIGTYAGKALVRMFVNTPRTAMAAIVAVLCALGAYATNTNISDVFLAFCFGVLGTAMNALGFPVSPLVLGLILGGDLLDVQFRRALMAGKGSIAPFFTRRVSIALIAFIVVIVFYQYILPMIRGTREEDRTVILE
jgi:putative tricarboxylic transport membrane protein